MSQETTVKSNMLSRIFAMLVIPVAFVVSLLIYNYILGDGANFVDGKPENNPLPGNYLGVVHKGGPIVPVLMTTLLVVLIFSVERFLTIWKAKGRGNVAVFVKSIQAKLVSDDVNGALELCDKQKGSVANVVRSGLEKYAEMAKDNSFVKEQKVMAIQKEVEESTSLELPMLQKNLQIISTIAPLGTLIGLLGTVLGMIRAFAALATAGAPDAVALSTGISEALINTALGIGTSAVAIVVYNFFTNRIDTLTYGIDEAGYSISQTFAAKH